TLYGRRVRHSLLSPVPSHAWSANQDSDTWRPRLACGPFRVVRAAPRQLLLARNDGSGFRPARLDTVDVRAMDPDEAVRQFRAGAIDVADDLPFEQVRRLEGVARIDALVGRSYLFVGWNLRDGRFSDRAVRRALAQAVDVRRIVHDCTFDQGDIA